MFKGSRMKFAKEGRAKSISHLDLMHAMHALDGALSDAPVGLPKAFNQHAYDSVAPSAFRPVIPVNANSLISIAPRKRYLKMQVEALEDVYPEGLRAIGDLSA